MKRFWCACSPHASSVPFPHQAGRTLLHRWAAGLDRKGEALKVLTADEFDDLRVHANKLPGLAEALDFALGRWEVGKAPCEDCHQSMLHVQQ